MIILKNTNEKQVFHILRNGHIGNIAIKKFQSKDYLVNKVGTFKILPDKGYFAMTSVNLDVDFTTDSKSETYTENGEYKILPNEDSVGLSDVTVTVDVQPPLQDKQVTYNDVGTYNVEADDGYYGLENVEITFDYPLEVITDKVTVNGTYTYEPSEGYKGISRLDLEVDISSAGLPIDLAGIGWSQSDIDTFVDPYAAGVEYAKQIQANWNPNTPNMQYSGDKQLFIFPKVDCANKTNLSQVFYESGIQYLPNLEIPNITNCVQGFLGTPIVEADLTGWKGTCDAQGLFWDAKMLQSVKFNNEFYPTNCYRMFFGCNLGFLNNIEGLNTSKSGSCLDMFRSADLSNTQPFTLDVSSCTNMENMFYSTTNIPISNLADFNTSNVTNMKYLFNATQKIPIRDFSKWDTSKVTSFNNMFYSAKFIDNTTTLNLSGWDFNSVTESNYNTGVYQMFCFCSDIKSINFTNAKMDKMGSMGSMWYYSYASEIILDGVTLPKVAMDWDSTYMHKHTLDTVLGILNALPDITGDGLSLTCKLGTQDLVQLTDEQKAVATAKGWTLA